MTWEQIAAQQDGVIARRQALDAGMTRHAWQWKLDRGLWQLALPGVAMTHNGGTTERERAWAAALHAGKGAVISGDAALSLAKLPIRNLKVVDLAIPSERRVVGAKLQVSEGGVVVAHRVAGLEQWSTQVRGLPLATTHAAVLHAASWAATERDAEWRIAAAVQRRITAVPRIRAALAQMGALPRRALIGCVLDDVELGAHAGSELQFLRFCRQHGLPRPDELQARLRTGRSTHYLDARYRRPRVTVEVDGAHHREVATWEADTLRTLRVAASMPGEQVLRLTPYLMRHDGSEVAELLRVILA